MPISLEHKFVITRFGNTPFSREQIEKVLEDLPIDFYLTDFGSSTGQNELGRMEVHVSAQVIDLYPVAGKTLGYAAITNTDFPLRPHNLMMTSQTHTRDVKCCLHPKLSAFDIVPPASFDEVEIDVHADSFQKSIEEG